ncbi:phosphoserine phosphatase SerB [Vibrio breoganii]|uniref:phosphoserine phosphatase SerB n=1 Tax=Vibrio breoganii TaxID=553239 RepID=UPI000C817A48|nr:phosphoserine phosphatase SerB [Vibrio breoganii]PMJ44528.1 phosphoserine phosphatase SerB [Vibrio breoganii]PMK51752.1 phosphoserine phosphatase SerB [Vibrio breoganii]PMO26945.1 phosphoserine phosphatase SerB [Vibrio breoganii]PMO28471.1 phosphoserine phosphatase SerB [Vibrio breoganii]PMO66887.1 phosphoserine phosphatase SerB [Vibrio breoganii]
MEVKELQTLTPLTDFSRSELAVVFADGSNDVLSQLFANDEQFATWNVGRYQVLLTKSALVEKMSALLAANKADFAYLTDLPDMSEPGLALFDMDSTLIEIECIDEIAKLAGVGEEVSEVTERAMQGELDFEQSLRQRVAKLADADESILKEVRSVLPLMAEAKLLIDGLKECGWKVAVASGGFTYFSNHLKELLELDFAQSNQLEIIEGKLTGNVVGDVVSAQTKADILEQLRNDYQFEKSNCIAVGDGANDLVMMAAAGLGIAYHAKPKVVEQAQTAVNYADLGGVLCLLSASHVLQTLQTKNL